MLSKTSMLCSIFFLFLSLFCAALLDVSCSWAGLIWERQKKKKWLHIHTRLFYGCQESEKKRLAHYIWFACFLWRSRLSAIIRLSFVVSVSEITECFVCEDWVLRWVAMSSKSQRGLPIFRPGQERRWAVNKEYRSESRFTASSNTDPWAQDNYYKTSDLTGKPVPRRLWVTFNLSGRNL